ncbi:MAG TPA: LuxR C-terminal-related transcriptional regulator [Polyangiaceae bacterium]|nr:LuxR C-terminal-related transcriptional regulator [Polyangiaceae bacterium]
MNDRALVALLEAIYSLETDNALWLQRTLAATRDLCGSQHTYLGYFYDASDVQSFSVWNVASVDMPPEVDRAFRSAQLHVSPDLLRATLRKLHVGSIRKTGMPHVGPLMEERERVGWGDIFSVNGLDPSGIGCLLTIGTRDRIFAAPPDEMAVYARVAQHLAAAFRCRRLLGLLRAPHGAESTPDRGLAEAIIDDEGRIVHAEGEAAGRAARERIRSAAGAITDIRKRGPRSGRQALDDWHPLVGARWTLVDKFEENGRRYVVARENQSREARLAALTDRERQVVLHATLGFTNKEIAYALGVSASTVRVLMARAASRIGVRTRAELLAHPSVAGVVDRATKSSS